MTDCLFNNETNSDGDFVCSRCGKGHPGPMPIFRNCKAPSMLGDFVLILLRRIGITTERYEYWTGKPCNCADRRDKLNRWHRAVKRWVGAFKAKFIRSN